MSKKKEITPCEISDQDCIAPAGFAVPSMGGWAEGDKSAKGRCVRCDCVVCGSCSRRVGKKPYRGKRLCNSCLEDLGYGVRYEH